MFGLHILGQLAPYGSRPSIGRFLLDVPNIPVLYTADDLRVVILLVDFAVHATSTPFRLGCHVHSNKH